MLKNFILSMLFGLSCCRAEDTNVIYVTDNGALPMDFSGGKMKIKSAAFEKAKDSRESLPAKDFPEGNWGDVAGGFQLSLRFEKTTFTNGEAIIATLLMRNVTNDDAYLSFSTFPVGYGDGPIGFKVVSAAGVELMQHQFVGGAGGAYYQWLLTGTQTKYVEHLDSRFDLTNGEYTIQAVKKAQYGPPPTQVATHKFIFHDSDAEVKSAEVKIKIVASEQITPAAH
jgi:hypothetical protein